MSFKRKKTRVETNINLVSMIDITSFILLALAILTMTMKKEASLDNILKLPPVLYAAKQDSTQLQIYVLPAKILPGGYIDPDSTGLVAFTGKGKPPSECPKCKAQIRNANGQYLPNTLLNMGKQAIASMESEKEVQSKTEQDAAMLMRPDAYLCAQCGYEISPYLKLDEIPLALKKKKKEVVDEIVATENYSRKKNNFPLLDKDQIKKIEEGIPLMIKADSKAFYGRILQVVNMAKDTTCDIKKFAFVTLAEAAVEAMKKEKAEKEEKKGK